MFRLIPLISLISLSSLSLPPPSLVSYRHAGAVEFAAGEWIGVELDEAEGKNDGAVDGVRYFSCTPRHGIYARRSRVQRLPQVYTYT